MSLIKCPECGKEISNQAVSCPNCGLPNAKFNIISEPSFSRIVDEEAERLNANSYQKKTTTRSNNKIILFVLVALAIVFIICVKLKKYNPNSNSSSYTSTYTPSYTATSTYSSSTNTDSSTSSYSSPIGEDITISTGVYVVGEDIVAGKYDVDYVSGRLALLEVKKNKDSLGAETAILMGDGSSKTEDIQHYSNLYLSKGNVVEITGGNLTVKLSAK